MAKQDVVLTAGLDVKEFNKGVNSFVNGINQMVSESAKASRSMDRLGQSASTGIGVAIGVAAASSIRSFTNSVVNLSKELIETLKFFESLQFSLETIIALNNSGAEAGFNMSEAIKKSNKEAQSYLLVLQDLAIYSPFTTQEIASANRTLQIYGMLHDEALGLTKLMVDFASVAGLDSERLQRIALATAQIFAEGRLLSRDALQLTQAGVPILRFVSNMTDQTVGEIQKLMRQGLLPASTALEALVEGLKDFEGSGKRVAKTARGLFSSLRDIRQITGRDLFKGVFEGVRPYLQRVVDISFTDEFRSAVTAIGNVIGQYVSSAINTAANAIGNFIKLLSGIPDEAWTVVAVFTAVALSLTAFGAAVGLTELAITGLISSFTVVVGAASAFAAIWVSGQLRIAQGSEDLKKKVADNTKRMADAFGDFGKVPKELVKTITVVTDAFGRAGKFIIDVFAKIERAASYATDVITQLLGNLVDWGASVSEVFASGIEGATGFIEGALGVVGAVITNLLKPGSPPKLLPDLDKWGKKAAEEWLKGWTEADFGILSDITKSIRNTLRALVSTGAVSNVDLARILIGSRKAVSQAIDQIRTIGKVTDSVMQRIRRAAGPAADEVEQLLRAYEAIAKSSKEVAAAQAELNAVTEKYDSMLEPIRKELERISEARRQGDENRQILELQRTIANEAVSAEGKRQAQLRIEEILMGRQVRNLEDQKQAAVDSITARKEAAEKALEADEAALKVIQARIDAQNEQISLYGQEKKALEDLARQLRKDLLKPLEDAIKRWSLMQQEIRDTIGLFKAQHTLLDASATEAQKIAAEIEQQAIAARRAKRDFELRELGVSEDDIQRLRDMNVVLADIGIKGTDDFSRFKQPDLSAIAEQVTGRIEDFNKKMDAFTAKINNARNALNSWLLMINEILPPSLKFIKVGEEQADLFKNLRAIFAGFVVIMASNRFISVLSSLPAKLIGVGAPLGFLTNMLGLFTIAWLRNWGDIQTKTKTAIDFVKNRFKDFRDSGGFDSILPKEEEFSSVLESVQLRWTAFVEYITSAFKDGISVQEFKNALSALESILKEITRSLFRIDIFAGIRDQIAAFYDEITDPKAMADAFNTFVENLRTTISKSFKQLSTGPSNDDSLFQYISKIVIGAATAFLMNIPIWVSSFIKAINTFLKDVKPTLGTLFDDFFSTIVPAILFMLGRSVGAIGSSLAQLAITALDIFFTEFVPAFLKALPRMLGALIVGFKRGIEDAGNDFINTLLAMLAGIGLFISTKLGPQILSVLGGTLSSVLSRISIQISRDIRKLISGFAVGLSQIGVVLLDVLGALSRDAAGVLRSIVSGVGGAFTSISTAIVKALGTGVTSAIRSVISLLSTGLSAALIAIGRSLQSFSSGLILLKDSIGNIGSIFRSSFSGLAGLVDRLFGKTSVLGASFESFLQLLIRFGIWSGDTGLKVFTPLFKGFDKFLEWLAGSGTELEDFVVNKLTKFGLKTGEVGVKVLDSVIAMAKGFGVTLYNSIKSVRGAIEGLISSFKSLASVSGLQNIAGKAGAVAIKGVKGLIESIGSIGGKGLASFSETLSGLGGKTAKALSRALPAIRKFGSSLFELLGGKFLKTTKLFASTFVSSLDDIGRAMVNLGKKGVIQESIANAFGGIRTLATSGLGSLKNIFAGGGGGIFRAISNLNFTKSITSIKNLLGLLRGVKSVLLGFLSPLALVTSAIDFFAFSFNAEIEGVENGARNLVDNLKQLWNDLISGKLFRDIVSVARFWLGNFAELLGLINKFGFDSDEVRNKLSEMQNVIVSWIKDTGTRIWKSINTFWIPAFVLWIKDTITNLVNSLGKIISVVASWIETAAVWLGSKIKDEWIPAFTEWWTEGGGSERTGETLNGILSQIGEWAVTAVEWIASKLAVWVPAFLGWIVDVTPGLIVGLGNILLTIGKWILETTPKIVNQLLEWAIAFVSWLGPATDNTFDKLAEWLGGLSKWIVAVGIPGLVKGVIGLASALIGWISGDKNSAEAMSESKLLEFLAAVLKFITFSVIPGIFKVGLAIAEGLWEGFKELWDQVMQTEFGQKIMEAPQRALDTIESWVQAGKDLISGLVGGIIGFFIESYETIKNTISGIIPSLSDENFLLKFANAGFELGKNIILGIVNGIKNWAHKPIEALQNFLSDLGNRGEEAIEAGSPSKLFARLIGKPIAEGIAEGIESTGEGDSVGTIRDSILSAMKLMVEEAKSQFSILGSIVTRTLERLNVVTIKKSDRIRKNLLVSVRKLVLGVTDELTNLSRFIEVVFNDIDTKTVLVVNAMASSIIEEIASMRSNIEMNIISLRSRFVSEFETMKNDSVSIVQIMVNDIVDLFITGPNSLIGKLTKGLLGEEGKASAAEKLGTAFIEGIAKGITSEESYATLFSAFRQIIDDTLASIRALYGIESPSKVAADMIGEPIVEGIIMGMERLAPRVSEMANSIGLTASLNSAFSSRPNGNLLSAVTNTSFQNTNQYYLNVSSTQESQGIIDDFDIMRILTST